MITKRSFPIGVASLAVALILASAGARAATPVGTPIALEVDASDAPTTSVVHVRETVPVTAGTVDLAYPRWVPGEHGPEGPIRNLVALHVTSGTREIPWSRDLADLNVFHIAVPSDVTSIDVAFDALNAGGGTYGESRLATSTILAINWNQYLLYPAHATISTVSFAPTLVLPSAAWTAQTALPDPVVSGNRVSYAPATMERLVDSPLDAGTVFKKFTLLDRDGFTNELDAFADRPAQLELPDKSLDGLRAIVGEMDAIYGARHWKNYHFLLTVSDIMPGNGVEHGSSSDDGSGGDALTDPKSFYGTADLLSHEFNHSWDGKYRRPADLAVDDFLKPEQTELLWIYEGMTQYYGDLVPVRAGITPVAFYRDGLALDYANEDHEPGRKVRPLIDTAASAPFLYDAGRALGGERRTAGDFYVEGKLLWLDVHARLAELSHGKKNLDGFAKTFFGIRNTPSEVNPYTYEQFVAALNAYQPYDWDGYFKSRVYRVALHPPSAFEALGYRLAYTDKPNEDLALRLKEGHGFSAAYSLGISGNAKGEISEAYAGMPAARAGIGFGDTVVAVDGREFDSDTLGDELVAAKKAGTPMSFILKRGNLYRTVTVDYHGGPLYPHLVRIDGTADGIAPLAAAHRAR